MAREELPIDGALSKANDETTKVLYEFGQVLFSEMHERLALLDSKAISSLGWNAALVAFLLIRNDLPTPSEQGPALLSLGLSSALVGVACAFLSLFARAWEWPRIDAWFEETLYRDPVKLRKQYIRTLYVIYLDGQEKLRWKGVLTRGAQIALAITATSVVILTLLSLQYIIRHPAS